MSGQLGIKILLLAAFVVLGILLIAPRVNARGRAVRRLALFLLLAAAAIFVIRPDWLSDIAQFLGVGRGTDLLLYALAVLVMANMVAARRTAVSQGRDITDLARTLALQQAPDPNKWPPMQTNSGETHDEAPSTSEVSNPASQEPEGRDTFATSSQV